MGRRHGPHGGPSGVLVIDKPAGMTSHDVVAAVRRRIGVRRVGHAGTLDPMATGVVVVMVGHATKLAPFLTADDKRYHATVQLGAATTTLDAEGEVTERAALPPWWGDEMHATERLARALDVERRRVEQVPPAYSAIRIEGRRAHRLARAGLAPAMAPRPVAVRSIELVRRGDDGSVELRLAVGKGYYVRSLARDLGQTLGCPAHLARLRRTASGRFDVAGAIPLDAVGVAGLVPTAEAAARAMPIGILNAAGARKAAAGTRLDTPDFVEAPATDIPAAWLDQAGRLCAVGAPRDGGFAVLRGFASDPDGPDGAA